MQVALVMDCSGSMYGRNIDDARTAARSFAEELAERIASFPQQCVVSDRNSAISQWGMGWNEALLNEYNLGKSVMGRAKDGAARFEWGAGRGGNFQDYK